MGVCAVEGKSTSQVHSKGREGQRDRGERRAEVERGRKGGIRMATDLVVHGEMS